MISLTCHRMHSPDQIANGTVDVRYLDETVKTVLRTKFALGLFESMSSHLRVIRAQMYPSDPYPYSDYASTMRTQATRDLLHQMEREAIVLLENNNSILPLSTNISSIALIGPQSDRVTVRPLYSLHRVFSHDSISLATMSSSTLQTTASRHFRVSLSSSPIHLSRSTLRKVASSGQTTNQVSQKRSQRRKHPMSPLSWLARGRWTKPSCGPLAQMRRRANTSTYRI